MTFGSSQVSVIDMILASCDSACSSSILYLRLWALIWTIFADFLFAKSPVEEAGEASDEFEDDLLLELVSHMF